jgi:glycosyltransferase involved in cell wall biosynthesis
MSSNSSDETPPWPSVSVVVPTFNSESGAFLRDCLTSITGQDYPGTLELIVCDGGSRDDSVAVAHAHGARILENVAVSELGRNGGRALGISQSRSRLVCLVDADNILKGPDYLARLVEPFRHSSRVTVSVPMPFVPARGSCPAITRYIALSERDYWLRHLASGEGRSGWSLVRPGAFYVPNGAIVDRVALDEVGGWDYDTEVGFRLARAGLDVVAVVPGALRLHLEAFTLRQLWRKHRRRAETHQQDRPHKPAAEAQVLELRSRTVPWILRQLGQPAVRLVQSGDVGYCYAYPHDAVRFAAILPILAT